MRSAISAFAAPSPHRKLRHEIGRRSPASTSAESPSRGLPLGQKDPTVDLGRARYLFATQIGLRRVDDEFGA